MKHLMIKDELHRELNIFRAENELKTLGDAISHLLEQEKKRRK